MKKILGCKNGLTRGALYERLGHHGVDVAFIRKLEFTDDELAAFEDRLARLAMKNNHTHR